MKTRFTEIITYFRTLAAQHVAIGHSYNEKHFYRLELEEVLGSLKNINYPALILEGYRYSLTDNKSDNVLKDRTGAFILIDHLHDRGDFDAIHEIWDNMEAICDDIIARICTDKRSGANKVIRNFDLNSIQVSLIANESDRNYGIRCTYTLSSSLSKDVDPNRWNLGIDIPD
jgi:hypothetical protein